MMTKTRSILSNSRLWIGLGILAFAILAGLFWTSAPIQRLLGQDLTWQRMERNRVWRVGIDPSFPPFEMLDAAGKPIGFDIDLAQQIADDWGYSLEIVALGFDSLLDALQAGKIDAVISALPYDPRETEDFIFSEPYFEAGLQLVVRPTSTILGLEDLSNHTVASEWGSIGDMVGRRLQREDPTIQTLHFATPEEAVTAIIDDPAIDALLIDNVTLRQAQGRGLDLAAVGPVIESNPYVIAMPIHATTLKTKITQILETYQATGVFTELGRRWFH